MTAPESIAGYAVWHADDYPLAIEYPLPLLEEIRGQAVDGFNSFAHGGLEIGGVLYGTRDGKTIRIASSKPLDCEHARGPGFVLSEKDQEAFAKLRKAPPGLECVGFYCSHTRGDLTLSPNDEVLFESYFPQTGRIALVVKPTHWGPAEATFCYRNHAGELCTPPPRCRFTIDPFKAPAAEAVPPKAAEPGQSDGSQDLAGPEPAAEPGQTVESKSLAGEPSPRSARWPWFAAAALAAALGVFYFLWPPTRRLDLRAYAIAPGQVRIDWNRRSPAVLGARSAVLEIADGASRVRLPLTAEQLRSTSITYARQTASILVRLRIEERTPGARPAEESAHFAGEPPPESSAAAVAPTSTDAAGATVPGTVAERQPTEPVAPGVPAADPAPPGAGSPPAPGPAHSTSSSAPLTAPVQATAPPSQFAAPVPAQADSSPRPSAPAPAQGASSSQAAGGLGQSGSADTPPLASRAAVPKAAPGAERPPGAVVTASVASETAAVEPARPFVPPPAASPRQAQARPDASALPAPPSVVPKSVSAPPLLAHVTPPPRPVRAPEPPAYTGPRSGRLIWIGSLGRRGVVEIDGARASVGSLTGALPRGVPLSFRVSPAQFSGHGLVVYTSDAALNNRRETAGKSNGWNATTFEWDPQRAAELAVLEAPNPTNDFNRLVLRNDARSCSVVVIDWTVR
jgi:proteasome lid subunit RPN8/RPN11